MMPALSFREALGILNDGYDEASYLAQAYAMNDYLDQYARFDALAGRMEPA